MESYPSKLSGLGLLTRRLCSCLIGLHSSNMTTIIFEQILKRFLFCGLKPHYPHVAPQYSWRLFQQTNFYYNNFLYLISTQIFQRESNPALQPWKGCVLPLDNGTILQVTRFELARLYRQILSLVRLPIPPHLRSWATVSWTRTSGIKTHCTTIML